MTLFVGAAFVAFLVGIVWLIVALLPVWVAILVAILILGSLRV